MSQERALDEGEYTVDDVTSGFNYTARTSEGLFGGWAATEQEAERKAQEKLSE